MGRKHAPQPLSLAEPQPQASSSPQPHPGGHASHGSVRDEQDDVAPVSTSPVPDHPPATSPRSPRAGLGVATSTDPSLMVSTTPTSSRSPRSPRSPYSKFNTSKQAQQAQAEAQTQAHISSTTSSPQPNQPSQFFVEPNRQPSPHLAHAVADDSDNSQLPHEHHDKHPRPEPRAEDPAQAQAQAQTQAQVQTRTQAPHAANPHTPTWPEGGATQYQNIVVQQPTPDREAEKAHKGTSRFFNFKASRSAQHLHQPPAHNHGQSHTDVSGDAMSRGTDYPPAMPDRVSSKASKHSDPSSADHSHQKSAPTLPSPSDLSLPSGNGHGDHDAASSSKKNKPKPFAILSRSKSLKEQNRGPSPRGPSARGPSPKGSNTKESREAKMAEPEPAYTYAGQQPTKNAPLPLEGQRHVKNPAARNHSADRALPRDSSGSKDSRSDREQHNQYNRNHASTARDNGGSAFLSGLKSSSTRAADMISKGLFGKGGRSGSTNEREPVIDDDHYQLKVINLPLVEQTRLTRISKRLEESRDKTEFWMPAFPWRAIDYLNYNGSDVEGLYRVPGSGPQIKKWQRRFDEEYDVNLFHQKDLYDINIIGSMLKSWLRELPDELFPKDAQDRVARECAGAEEVPQLLVEELSNLSPYNYYLLFAITCHLSLLLAHSDKNKMDFRNLCICFQPCMKIDAFCFRFLVCDWRQCWQGCKTEQKYIEEEYKLMDQPPPRGLQSSVSDQRNQPSRDAYDGLDARPTTRDDRSTSPSDGSQQLAAAQESYHGNPKTRKKPLPTDNSNGSLGSSAISTNLTIDSERDPQRSSGDLRPLSPIKPLSPLGF